MDRHFSPVSLFFFMLCVWYFIKFTVCFNDPAYLLDDVSISCGSAGTSAAHSGREWLGDTHPIFASSVQIKGESTISSVVRDSVSVDPVPYRNARISSSGFSYVFLVSPGEKFIRLHFNPTPYKGFQKYNDLFTVEAGPFTLLSNFSASLTADALGLSSINKVFGISVEENQPLQIVFTPASSLSGHTYTFLNGIEIITIPLGHSYFHADGGIGAQVVGHKSQQIYVDNSTALEMIRRVNMKRDGDDIRDNFGTRGTVPREKANQINNITWKTPVDAGFKYLIRLHFLDLGLKFMQETGSMNFEVLINEETAYNNMDLVSERDTNNVITYKDYIVILKGRKEGVKHDLLVSLRSYGKFINGYGPFMGFEILKLSSLENNLACPNLLPPARDLPSSSIQTLHSALGRRNTIVAISITIIALANIIVHKLREIMEASCVEEENKPSARAERFCRHFSLAEMQLATRNFSDHLLIGKGGFGKVYKGLIDNGKETVAIKRQKPDSRQGALEFLTEIETLSKLRHINLVSLIGYCNEQREMILVYEYMACGTLGDHLYKLARKGNNCASLTWKQRLNICIGAGRGLDYLHTGQGVIHRDIKASNILLDENFIPKVSDFGLVKHENLSYLQSHVSTKVKGTFGYLDPTYCRTGKLTRKSDTYAFGVVLLEVLCGRPALDQRVYEAKRILTNWSQDEIREEEIELIVASNIITEISRNSLKTFLEIVERCLDEEPKKRPTMAQVVLQLEFALKQQDIMESSIPKEIMTDTPCTAETNLSVGDRAVMAPSIDEQTPTSPPDEQTYSRMDYDDPPHQIKEGRQVTSFKASRIWSWDALWKKVKPHRKNDHSILSEICKLGIDLPKFDWAMLAVATDDYSFSNKVGYCGYHPIYKAVFRSGLIVAVKRLSAAYGYNQNLGRDRFINEILIVQKLQHPNILELLGYCVHEEKIILVHEFMENKSLDDFIHEGKFQHVQWTQRFRIIMGIARGVAYLSQDSGMRIIHRDLKPGHILLDINMNAKISGFDLAKTLEEDSFESISMEVCGTNGYICPEYLTSGKLSINSDVYGFGVLVLEIMSGWRCNVDKDGQCIVIFARKLWQENRALGMVDVSIGADALTSVEKEGALRCIKVGLLCTLGKPDCRPTMPRVIKLLKGELSVDLPEMERLIQQERNASPVDDIDTVLDDVDEVG